MRLMFACGDQGICNEIASCVNDVRSLFGGRLHRLQLGSGGTSGKRVSRTVRGRQAGSAFGVKKDNLYVFCQNVPFPENTETCVYLYAGITRSYFLVGAYAVSLAVETRTGNNVMFSVETRHMCLEKGRLICTLYKSREYGLLTKIYYIVNIFRRMHMIIRNNISSLWADTHKHFWQCRGNHKMVHSVETSITRMLELTYG